MINAASATTMTAPAIIRITVRFELFSSIGLMMSQIILFILITSTEYVMNNKFTINYDTKKVN